jgi:thioredoxin reductase (NADPH)
MGERFDVAVIGTGPAGVSAAITLKIRNKNIILFGNKNLSEKVSKAHEIKNYPGLPDIKGEELKEKFLKHLSQLDIEITEDMITAVYAMGSYYSLQSKSSKIYEAASVIIATGVSFEKMLPGEKEFLGRGVSYCATCDAALYRGKSAAVIGYSEKEEAEAEFLAEVAEKVYYIPMYKTENAFSENITVVNDIPVSVESDSGLKADRLVLKNQTVKADGIFVLRDSVSLSQLVAGLEMSDNHVAVNRNCETNLSGCFACGDVTGQPYQYIKAAGEGNVAALSAVKYLDKKI